MKTFLALYVAGVALIWALAGAEPGQGTGSLPWMLRHQAMYLTGLWAFSLMSLIMVLATRPAWLERAFGGLDKMYRTHKWAGILAISFAALHWLVEMSDDVIKALWGRAGRLPKEHGDGILEALRDMAEELGEWAIYALLAMLVLTLWKRFPFHLWRYLHKAMPVLYLALVIHAAFLAPVAYWSQPVGWMLAVMAAAGSVAALMSLLGRIGERRRHVGTVESVSTPAAGVTEVVCQLGDWPGHRAGQFVFLNFDRFEGPHPFTIASADAGDGRLRFVIKALGDYTETLARRVQAGQPVTVEGPYGCFDHRRARSGARQIWVAAGVGVTPFLAWLESMQGTPQTAAAADLYYCVRNRDTDPFVSRVTALCANLPAVRLTVISTDREAPLSAERMKVSGAADVWFCGPKAFGAALREGLGRWRVRFHQEAFEMR